MIRRPILRRAVGVALFTATALVAFRTTFADGEHHLSITRSTYNKALKSDAFRFKHYGFRSGPRVLYYHPGYVDGGLPNPWVRAALVNEGPVVPGVPYYGGYSYPAYGYGYPGYGYSAPPIVAPVGPGTTQPPADLPKEN
ncbi:MAG: hypothetical protein IT428_18165 [Planctomycetaceae bacterium]|nr:hypothetical protein [Planctomycetaceae bacterium]